MIPRAGILMPAVVVMVAGLVLAPWSPARGQDLVPTLVPGAESPGPERPAKPYTWRWYWDRGIRYQLELPFEQRWTGPDEGLVLHQPLEKRFALIGTIGARVQVDGAAYLETDGLDHVADGIEMRRLRVGTRGDFYLLGHASYALDLEIVKTDVRVGDVYLWWDHVPFVGGVKVGNFTPPLSIEARTSSRDIVFMESALPVQAFGPGRSSGVEIGRPFFGERGTWAVGLMRTIATPDEGDQTSNAGRFVARLTWLAEDARESRRLTHVGASMSVLFAAENVRYRTWPESHLAPAFLDTGTLEAASSSAIFGLELTRIHGPWLLMAEFLGANPLGRGALLHGAYGSVSRSLTGETQPYDRTSAILGRFAPTRPFSLRQHAYGALRAGGRISYLDLTADQVRGGHEMNLTANLSWFLNRYLSFKLEYGFAAIRGRPDDGNLHFVQTRMQLDFF